MGAAGPDFFRFAGSFRPAATPSCAGLDLLRLPGDLGDHVQQIEGGLSRRRRRARPVGASARAAHGFGLAAAPPAGGSPDRPRRRIRRPTAPGSRSWSWSARASRARATCHRNSAGSNSSSAIVRPARRPFCWMVLTTSSRAWAGKNTMSAAASQSRWSTWRRKPVRASRPLEGADEHGGAASRVGKPPTWADPHGLAQLTGPTRRCDARVHQTPGGSRCDGALPDGVDRE